MLPLNRVKVIRGFCGLLLLPILCGAFAQTNSTTPTVGVTGKDVPDAIGYQMVFLALSIPKKPTDNDLTAQKSYAAAIGLEASDVSALLKDTSNFRNEYADAYAQVDEASPDTAVTFNAREKDLVTETHSALARDLSPDGLVAFEAFVQGEKNKMVTVLPGQ